MPQTGHDQTGIWTRPLRVSHRDAVWLVPFAAGTAVALHYDAQAQQNLGIDKSRIDTSNIISGFSSPYATLGGTAGLYFLGLGTHMSALPKQGVWERRSEEHTSELQSHSDLVCRLLLEKKKPRAVVVPNELAHVTSVTPTCSGNRPHA